MDQAVEVTDGLMLFDGHCRFCSTSVDIALSMDREGVLRFTPIQTPYGRLLAERHGLDPDDPSTFFFFEKGQPLAKSDGVIALSARLKAPLRWARAAKVFPRSWRDAIYDWIAANRYRLLGRRDACRMPKPGEAERFILDPPG